MTHHQLNSEDIIQALRDVGKVEERVNNNVSLLAEHRKESKENYKELCNIVREGFFDLKNSILQDVDARKAAVEESHKKLNDAVAIIQTTTVKVSNEIVWIKKGCYAMMTSILFILGYMFVG